MGMARIVTETHGSGEPILFLHGLGGTSNVFTPQVNVLSRFFTCIRPDLPGHGRSAVDGPVTIGSLVDSTLEVLDRERVSGPVAIVAHSMGTVVAQHLTLKAPDRVRSLCLIGPVHAPSEAARAGLRERAAKSRLEGLAGIADQIVAGGTSAATKGHRPEVVALVREMIMRQDPEGYALHCEALAGAQPADVASIAAPALLITGDEDNTSPAPASKALASLFPRASLKILDRTGHWATFERPGNVNEALVNFLISR